MLRANRPPAALPAEFIFRRRGVSRCTARSRLSFRWKRHDRRFARLARPRGHKHAAAATTARATAGSIANSLRRAKCASTSTPSAAKTACGSARKAGSSRSSSRRKRRSISPHWFTPAPFDTEPFDLVSKSSDSVTLRKSFDLTNYSGTKFNVRIDREIRLLPTSKVWADLKFDPAAGAKRRRLRIGQPAHQRRNRTRGRRKPGCCRYGAWACSTPRRPPRLSCRSSRARNRNWARR